MLHLNITKLHNITKEDLTRLLEIEKTGHFAVSLPRTVCKTKEGLARSLREYTCAVYFLQQLSTVARQISFMLPDINEKGSFKFKFSRPLTKALAAILERTSEFYNGTNAEHISSYRIQAHAIWAAIRDQQITFECPGLISFMKRLEEKEKRAAIEANRAAASKAAIAKTA